MNRRQSIYVFALLILVCSTVTRGEEPAAPVIWPVPINPGEGIIDAFWDPDISSFDAWTVAPGPAWGLEVHQNWCAVDYAWARKPDAGPALRMWRDVQVGCGDYDRFLVRLQTPENAEAALILDTDRGERRVREPGRKEEFEYAVELDGAARIHRITLEIYAGSEGMASGWLRWTGVQNAGRLEAHLDTWRRMKPDWRPFLVPADAPLVFKPRYGIFVTEEELADLRSAHEKEAAVTGASPWIARRDAALLLQPETGISRYATSGGDTNMFGRSRDRGMPPLEGRAEDALTGLVLRDRDVLAVAARYALSLGACAEWDYGFVCDFPVGSFEARPFRRSYRCEDVAYVLDVAGELFTEAGRRFLMRRLAEEGVGPINYASWRHEYIHHCNQMAYFNKGRMFACLVLEREWPRVKPYTDLAFNDTVENLENAILPDGGYLEGPSYFGATARRNYTIIQHYARARGLPLDSLVPDALRRTGDFAALMMSTTTRHDVLPIGDGEDHLGEDTLRAMLELMPGSHWLTLYNHHLRNRGKDPLPEDGPPLPAFVHLPDMGCMASVRYLDGEPVKLFIQGFKQGADHTHEDKGSFVLEFAGETFAMDPGICDYTDPMHHVYKSCQRHNMLVPASEGERPAPMRPLLVDVKPEGHGDAQAFHARIDATRGWRGWYRKWVRTWDSPSPDRLTITDDYELGRGEAVDWYWQTQLPCRIEGRNVLITGTRGQITLETPEDCTLQIEELPLAEGSTQHRITLHRDQDAGVIEVTIHLQALEKE